MTRGKEIALRVRDRLKELRLQEGVTQEKLAEISGVDYKHIQLLEGSNPPAARIDTLEKLAGAFRLELADFFTSPVFAGKRSKRARAHG